MAMSQRMWRREQERRRRERERRARRRRNCAIAVILIAIAAGATVTIRYCTAGGPVSEQTTAAPVTATAIPTPAIPSRTPIPVSELRTSFYDDSAFVGNALADGIALYGILPQTDVYAKVGIDLDNAYTTAADNASTSVVDQLKSSKFSKVFLCFGESELAAQDAQAFYDKYRELIATVKEYQQSARIYLIAIPPVTEEVSDSSSTGMTIDNIRDYNDTIKELAYDEDVYFADAYEALADNDGYLENGVSADGINLNRDCYIEMLNYIADNVYIPDREDLASSSESSDGEDGSSDEEQTERPRRTETAGDDTEEEPSETASPKPAVNVLKDSASTERPSRESEDSE